MVTKFLHLFPATNLTCKFEMVTSLFPQRSGNLNIRTKFDNLTVMDLLVLILLPYFAIK